MEVKKKMNFGETILSWIKTIYTEPQSSTQVNGHICVRGAIQKKRMNFTKILNGKVRRDQNIINPLCKTKWVILARHWIGFQLARLNHQWKFFGENHLPWPDKDIYANYYGDIKWTTKFIYLWLAQQKELKHATAKCWRFVQGIKAEGIWKGTYTSYAQGVLQDTHFKFLHGVHKTNWFLKKKSLVIDQTQSQNVMCAGKQKR